MMVLNDDTVDTMYHGGENVQETNTVLGTLCGLWEAET